MAPTNHQKHQAGRHLAVGHALLRGYSAEIVGPHRYVKVNDLPAVVMLAGMGAWQIADVDDFTSSHQERYILVDVTDETVELYLVPGDELRKGVRERHESFLVRVGGTRPRNPESRHAAIEPAHVAQWRDQWSLFDQ
ncbi:hypothetical protein [Catellatospora vulcania]|uniref:hypothetical protein n=1 Tax=Catellatospora vulcania TaxID=1460450 RepID=UPI0012D44822|nr:hypothetical protein [Catellatospora vulcania]